MPRVVQMVAAQPGWWSVCEWVDEDGYEEDWTSIAVWLLMEDEDGQYITAASGPSEGHRWLVPFELDHDGQDHGRKRRDGVWRSFRYDPSRERVEEILEQRQKGQDARVQLLRKERSEAVT